MKYFLFDHSGSLNRGCEAIIRGTLNIISRADPDASFKLASFDPGSDAHFNIPTCSMACRDLTQVEKAVSAFNVKLRHSERYALKKMYSTVTDEAKDYDICLSVGGDTYCYGDNAPIREITSQLHKSGKKTVLWGASVGKEDLTAEKIEAFKSFDAIFVREPLTYELLEKIVPSGKLFSFADPAFCMEREDLPLPDGFEQGNTLGFNLSPLVCAKNPDLTDACVGFLKKIIENTTLQIALIPHVTADGNNDCDVLDEIYDKLSDPLRVIKIPGNLTAPQYKGYIARLRFFIGARTHATIAAYSNGVPTIVLSYSVKARGISADLFSGEKFVIDSKTVSSPETLEAQFKALVEQESEIRSDLRRMIPIKIKSALDAGQQLLKL
ncbi:MAG: polysaccharide pyruvyl transferase family protein [Acutalibacteraceae bacterium]